MIVNRWWGWSADDVHCLWKATARRTDDVCALRGETGRRKTVEIDGGSPATLQALLRGE